MGSTAIASSVLDSLPPRPPTPPRDAKHALNPLAKPALSADPTLSLQTPPGIHEPDSGSSSTSRRKRVGFSAKAEYKEIAPYAEGEATRNHPTPVSLPSSSARPVKSILKATSTPNPIDPLTGNYFDINNPGQINIVTMLDSTIQQLAGADRNSKLDAYMMLGRALKASNNLPDRIALQDKMSLFMQFIQRDMTTKNSHGSLDTSLVNHSLNLLITFLHFPAIASTLSNDFGVFIVDHCIRSFEDKNVPKDIIRHLMQVIAFQNFSPKVMTSDRVGRLVATLHKIEEYLTGKSIVMSRIHIYRKLIKQCKQQMLLHTDWLLDLFTDMLSSMREIRSAAIALGLDAAYTLGREKLMARRVMEILQLTFQEQKYIEYYAYQLTKMIESKTESASVPQIWSVVILLLPGPEKWDFFLPWLKIIQLCFNSPDYQTKQEANFAWCRLTYKIQLDDRGLAKMIATLSGPLASQLKRRSTGKHSEDLRRVVLGSICNIFYYAFKPNANLTLLDKYWDDSVRPLMERLLDGKLERAKENMTQASTILSGLFDSSTPRLWKEDHVVDKPLVRPEELPAIDAKWVRRNASKVFAIVGPIIETNFLELSVSGSTTYKLWKSLVGSVASAASKEIKVSVDTATFMAHAFGVLMRIWTKGLAGTDYDSEEPLRFLGAAKEFVLILVDSLGVLPFTEKLLAMSKPNNFVPVATPSHRTNKNVGLTKSPLLHLFSILSSLPPGVPDDESFAGFLQPIFAPFFASRGDKAQADLAQELLQTVPFDSLLPYGPWLFVSKKIEASLDATQHSHQTTGSGSEPPIGHEYRDIVKVLERGLRSTPNLPFTCWQSLFVAVSERVRDETGDAGLAIVVVEHLAKALIELVTNHEEGAIPPTYLNAATALMVASTHPRDRQAVEAARRRLWGSAMTGSRSASFDPLENVYKLESMLLVSLYDQFEHYDPEKFVVPLLKEISSFLDRCNSELLVRSLVLLQDGLACWIRDGKNLLNGRQSPAALEAVKLLSGKICTLLTDFEHPEDIPLASLESLLCAAFDSKHQNIVNTICTMWNRLFDNTTEIQYPERLRDLLISIHPFVDIVLPGLDVSSFESASHQPAFLESQEDAMLLDLPSPRSAIKSLARPSSSHRSSPISVDLSMSASRRRFEATPTPRASKPLRQSATPKLRHDDSQVQFAAIDSSPLAHAHESQNLTDRQMEVRERQKENAVLFPEIRSSPGATKDKAVPPVLASLPVAPQNPLEQDKATTPEPDGDFEEYITSTPTPRRGQPVILPDQELPDLPSPGTPRRYPLLSELQRSRSGSSIDEWTFEFSSSPVSGSPNPRHHIGSAAQAMELDEVNENLQPDGLEVSGGETEEALATAAEKGRNRVGEHAEPVESSPAALPAQRSTADVPSTPSRRLRSMAALGSESDDVFMDAHSSPIQRTPRPKARSNQPTPLQVSSAVADNNQSFEVSDVDERSLMRVAAEMERRGARPQPVDSDLPSSQISNADEPETRECITVGGEKRRRGRPRKHKLASSSAPVPPTPVVLSIPAVEKVAPPSPQEKPVEGKRGRKKRKRSHSKTQREAGSSAKKQKHQESGDEVLELADGQADSVAGGMLISGVPQQQKPIPFVDAAVQPMGVFDENEVSDLSMDNPAAVLPTEDPVLEEALLEVDSMEIDAMHADDDIQSQIAQEADEAMGRTKEYARPAETSTEVDANPMKEREESEQGEPLDTQAPARQGDDKAEAAETPKSKLGELMGFLRSGLDILRFSRFSREEVYEVEDMFMDMKRELYEAERRGRQDRQ
ncbi:Telomere length regulator protein rif1 [Pleurostoma richardsiae]|uniref:Telomere length regulator protein rif1 n=1 Tax=Pleurostoma richardsiae TaxID=41990 RepID=A0AA38VUJ6_9PEZI|nr:Telomere length regulator protein rif1 [Pleurostoma richardsiae]